MLVCYEKKEVETKKIKKKDHTWINRNICVGCSGYWIKKHVKIDLVDHNVEPNVCSVIVYDLNMNDKDITNIVQKMKYLDISVLFLCCQDSCLSDFMGILDIKKLQLSEVCLLMPLEGNDMIIHEKTEILEMGCSMFLFLKQNVKYNKKIQQKWSNFWIYQVNVSGGDFGLNEELLCLFESFVSMLFGDQCDIHVIGKEKNFSFQQKKKRYCSYI